MLIPFLHRIVRKSLVARGIASKAIDLGECPLHYYEASPPDPAETIVLVHGLGTSASTWTHVLPFLAHRYRVIAPDLPGFGFSPPLADPSLRPIETFGTVLDRFLEQTTPGGYLLLGHSLGGWLAMKHAIRHPDRVRHLVLINTAGIYFQGAEELAGLFDIRSTGDTNRLLSRLWNRYPWYLRIFTPFVYEDMVKRRVPDIIKGISESDFVDTELEKLYMPVSIIWGEEDSLLSPETVKILGNRLPARTVHMIPEAGHVPHLETTERFLEVLEKVLDGRVL